MIDPIDGDVQFENEGTLEPLPIVKERSVVMRAVGLTKTYAAVSTGRGAGRPALELFRGLDLKVHAGEMVAIVGESGAGKSSLLHLLAALDTPTAGDVWCGETRLSGFTPKQAAEFRNRDVGYVWQFHYLLPEFSALENVAMPLLARGMTRGEALKKARYWLSEVGLADRADNRSGELSGGEQQRVAVARALINKPALIFADEPSGNLDSANARDVHELFHIRPGGIQVAQFGIADNIDASCRQRLRRILKGIFIGKLSQLG